MALLSLLRHCPKTQKMNKGPRRGAPALTLQDPRIATAAALLRLLRHCPKTNQRAAPLALLSLLRHCPQAQKISKGPRRGAPALTLKEQRIAATATLLSLLLNRGIGGSTGVCLRTVLDDWEPPDLSEFQA